MVISPIFFLQKIGFFYSILYCLEGFHADFEKKGGGNSFLSKLLKGGV